MKKCFPLFIFAFLLLNFEFSTAQNVGIGTNTPEASAQLDVTSTSRGLLPPRMTYAQRNAIVSPAAGLIIYCIDCDSSGQPQFYNGTRWCNFLGGLASGVLVANLPSVTICNQTWTTQNLNVSRYRNGDLIPQVTDATEWANLTSGAWCWFDNDSASYAATYGRLYNWYAVNDPRGLAPFGWHVPTDAEWNKLIKCIDPGSDTSCENCRQSDTAGGAIKSTMYWYDNGNGTNSSGFSGLPGGYRYNNNFLELGLYSGWWTSTGTSNVLAWHRSLYHNNPGIGRNYPISKQSGQSVRLVRD